MKQENLILKEQKQNEFFSMVFQGQRRQGKPRKRDSGRGRGKDIQKPREKT